MNPNKIVNRIVQSAKVPSDKKFTSLINMRYKFRRQRTSYDSHLSQPFSKEEIDTALSSIKNGKAAGADAIYPEFDI